MNFRPCLHFGGCLYGSDRMKRFIIVILITFILTSSLIGASVDNQYLVELVVDGETLNTVDLEQGINTPAFIYNSRTMLPLKMTLEIFGISDNQVSWNPTERSITIYTNENDIIWMQIDNNQIRYNGNELTFDVPAKIFNNRTYVPVAMISSLLGEKLVWDGKARTVTLNPSTMELARYGVSFEFDRKKGFTKPVMLSDKKYYMIYDKEGVIFEMYIVRDENGYNNAIMKSVETYGASSERYTILSENIKSVYYELGPKEVIVFFELNGEGYEMKFHGLTLNEIRTVVESFKVVK